MEARLRLTPSLYLPLVQVVHHTQRPSGIIAPPPPSILGRRGAQRRTAHDGAAHGGSPAARGALWEAEGKNMADGEEP